MPRAKQRPESIAESCTGVLNGSAIEVLTLTEAAAYLRLPAEDVLRLVAEERLPARQVGQEWRFLKDAIKTWLSKPYTKEGTEGVWAAAGSWQGDPYLDDLLGEVYHKRGRPMTEE